MAIGQDEGAAGFEAVGRPGGGAAGGECPDEAGGLEGALEGGDGVVAVAFALGAAGAADGEVAGFEVGPEFGALAVEGAGERLAGGLRQAVKGVEKEGLGGGHGG